MVATVTRVPNTDGQDGIGDILDIVIRESNRDREGRQGLLQNDTVDGGVHKKKSKIAIFAVGFVFTLIVVMAVILLATFLSPPHRRKGNQQEEHELITNSSLEYTNETETISGEKISFVALRTVKFTNLTDHSGSTSAPSSTDIKNSTDIVNATNIKNLTDIKSVIEIKNATEIKYSRTTSH